MVLSFPAWLRPRRSEGRHAVTSSGVDGGSEGEGMARTEGAPSSWPESLPTLSVGALRPSFSTPELPRAGYLVRERVSVGMFSYRVADSEAFDEPRGENTACSPKLVEK